MSEEEILSAYQARFEAMHALIDKAVDDSQNDSDINLGSLDQDVAKLCEEVVTLDAAIARKVGEMLTQLVSKLDQLEVMIRARKESKNG